MNDSSEAMYQIPYAPSLQAFRSISELSLATNGLFVW